jgi:cytochrome c-type biogenesis protein CcmH/NrfF
VIRTPGIYGMLVAASLLLTPVKQLAAEPKLNSVQLDPAEEQEALWVFSRVLSPFCPGKLLQDCPSSAASDLKNEVRGKVKAGKTREEVLADLYLVYGDEISAVPRTVGFGLLAWIAPGAFVFAGLAIAFLWLRSKYKEKEAKALSSEMSCSLSDEQKRRINALLE